jgi:DNA-binding response OmpR family regulator
MKIDVLKGFAAGAVDYLKKPIDEEELVARIEVLLKRLHSDEREVVNPEIAVGKYRYNFQNQELVFNRETTRLTARENELLHILVSNRNNLCSHRDILLRLWGKNDYFNRKSLHVFVTRLRKYLERDPSVTIENVHGRGFILRAGQ